MNSGSVVAGTDGWTTMTRAPRIKPATGAMSNEIEIKFVVERRIDRVRGTDQEERVAVRRRAHDRLSGDIAACARPVLDDEWLAKPLRQPLTDQTREDVVRAAGGKT